MVEVGHPSRHLHISYFVILVVASIALTNPMNVAFIGNRDTLQNAFYPADSNSENYSPRAQEETSDTIFSPPIPVDLPDIVFSSIRPVRDTYDITGMYDIKITDNGTLYAVWGACTNNSYVICFSKSRDGIHWSDIKHISRTGAWGDRGRPKLAITPDGKYVFAGWVDLRNDPDGKFTTGSDDNRLDIYFAYSTDHGEHFEEDKKINADGPDHSCEWINDITCDPTGKYVYVLTTASGSGVSTDVYVIRSTDSGATFEGEIMVNTQNDGWYCEASDIEISPFDPEVIYIAWERGFDPEIVFSVSTDGSTTFYSKVIGTDPEWSSGSYSPRIVLANNSIFILWCNNKGLYYSVSLDNQYFPNFYLPDGCGVQQQTC